MLVRLLVAVLMLTGPLPVRACTCAAVTGSPHLPGTPAPDTPPDQVKGCGCSHRAAEDGVSPPAETGGGGDRVATPTHPDRHDRDCPAVQPRPVVSAVLTPAADLPADPGVGLFVPVESPISAKPGVTSHVRPAPVPPAVPLYLSTLSLRI